MYIDYMFDENCHMHDDCSTKRANSFNSSKWIKSFGFPKEIFWLNHRP